MYTNYYDMSKKLAHGETFKGNNVTCKKNTFMDRHGVNHEVYAVYSYATIMYRRETIVNTGEIVSIKFDNRFYSMTTRKIQGVILRAGIVPDGFPLTIVGPRGGVHGFSARAELKGDGWKVF